jgi:ATP synthase protein I
MPEPKKPLPSLDELQRKIDEVKSSEATEQDGNSAAYASGMAQGTNIAVEFAVTAAIGGVGGYFLDRWLGTSPLLLLTGFFIGFAAGVYNLMRGQAKKK